MPTLSQLILYPIKSCAAMPVAEAQVTVSGLVAKGVHVREWMLVRPNREFLTQRIPLHGTTCRLVRFRPGLARPTSTRWAGGAPSSARFADAYPLLLVGEARHLRRHELHRRGG